MDMLAVIFAGFAAAVAAPWVHRSAGRAAGWLLALVPAAMSLYFAEHLPAVSAGETISVGYDWAPSLGLRLSLSLDGLSLMFALLICPIGALVLVYAGEYLAKEALLGRFYSFLLLFLTSMLGLVLADNVIALYIFWELTSITSYLLIGFHHERAEARASALQAVLVTGMGGLALLAGLLLLGQAAGSHEISEILGRGEAVRAHALYVPALVLVLLGAFTKSAQFPFHFWLPNAMEAPTAASAYLHAATMVKAGVYLLARLSPVLAGTALWHWTVTVAGALTMLAAGAMALKQTYLKKILAYSTVASLGILVFLLGLGTAASVQAAVVFLFAHALYKGALFLVAGVLDHEAGEKNAERLGGLFGSMPLTGVAGVLAGLSMAGMLPLLGFIGKETVYEALLHSGDAALLWASLAVLANALVFVPAWLSGIRPFLGKRQPTPKLPHEAPVGLWLGPLLLAVASLLGGLFPGRLDDELLGPAASAILGRPEPLELALWHGWTAALALSALTLVLGMGFYVIRKPVRRMSEHFRGLVRLLGPEAWYERILLGVTRFASLQTRLLQSGYLRLYVLIILLSTLLVAGMALARGPVTFPAWQELRLYEAMLALLIVAAAIAVVLMRSWLNAIAALGVVGYGMAALFILFGAPDLAITQFVIDTLTLLLFVLVFYRLPAGVRRSPRPALVRDAAVSGATGVLMALLTLVASGSELFPSISDYFVQRSVPDAHGRNIVNVILVDFRALDTLGEITVLAIAAVGVYALLHLRAKPEARP
jgi:multicomponent Na+:H+ antiporter subunit A